MKKVSIIYWSAGGNVEVLADNISKGAKSAGAEVEIKQVHYAKPEEVLKADAVAFGSPSMDNNQVDQTEMAPFLKNFKDLNLENKPVVLFGSYGWDNGEFIEKWETQMKEYGFNVIGKLAVQEAPNEKQLEEAKKLGQLLAK
ncbi:flavodoxin [Clostridium cochlearium]|uniref:Flavodoxin n=1 Tax=Clostridium cochlearium TaxID=1494 RepID=A0A7Y3XYW5_CLOCO|nr:flavodoxin [Clostridium cochlearium]NME95901.1 flavodoxin [Clostridium cochlearium]NOH16407.1 flavodoxin [Clostridium cochlearium]